MPTTIAIVTNAAGQKIPATAYPADAIEVWEESGSMKCLTNADLFTYPPLSSPASSITSVLNGSVTVASTFFGMHVQQSDNIARACDELPFSIARSHDSGSGLRWHSLNPTTAGVYDWTNSDEWVNAMWAQGKQICFLLGFTPNWAAASTPGTGKYDNGTTVTGSNQPPANFTNWSNFCTAIATRYSAKVKYWEIWNETNYTSYWAGTAAQLAQLTRLASQAIKAVDATAKIVAPIVQEPETGGTGNAYLGTFLDASDGAAGTGKLWVDICGIHMYPPKYNYQVHKNQIDNVKATLAARSLSSLEIWNTETGVLQGVAFTEDIKVKWLKRSLVLSAACGVARYFWYTYDNPLMFMGEPEKAAWREVRAVLLSGAMTGCNLAPDGRVACTIAGRNYLF